MFKNTYRRYRQTEKSHPLIVRAVKRVAILGGVALGLGLLGRRLDKKVLRDLAILRAMKEGKVTPIRKGLRFRFR